MAVTGFTKLGVSQKPWVYADQGNYFVATNPTPGTGVASGTVTSLADTTPLLIVKNNNPVNSGVRLYLDQLRLVVTVIGSGGTTRNLTLKTDASQTTTRYTSGGSTITPVNVNSDSGATSSAQVFFGAITAAAAGSARLLGNIILREVIEVAFDTYVVDFGGYDLGPTASLATAAGATTARSFHAPPVVIGPQEHFLAHFWAGSAGGATSFEFELGYLEL